MNVNHRFANIPDGRYPSVANDALLDDYAMVHRQANEENDEIIFGINFSAGSGWNNNIQTEFYLFVYREGWTDLGFSSIYCNDYASVMPTKYSYLLFDWKKDRRTEVTFMSPLNGDPATSVDGRAYGRNWFESTNGVNVAKGDTVIYFPVPGEINNCIPLCYIHTIRTFKPVSTISASIYRSCRITIQRAHKSNFRTSVFFPVE